MSSLDQVSPEFWYSFLGIYNIGFKPYKGGHGPDLPGLKVKNGDPCKE